MDFPVFDYSPTLQESFNIIKIGDYELVLTCPACPEQYDVFIGTDRKAYFRLRHGTFTVEVPDCGDTLLFEAYPNGDGCFTTEERERYLTEAIMRVDKYYNPHKSLRCPLCECLSISLAEDTKTISVSCVHCGCVVSGPKIMANKIFGIFEENG